nr:hypothetical protein [Vampirovibrio sp.]
MGVNGTVEVSQQRDFIGMWHFDMVAKHKGATLSEYGMVFGLAVLIVVPILLALGTNIEALLSRFDMGQAIAANPAPAVNLQLNNVNGGPQAAAFAPNAAAANMAAQGAGPTASAFLDPNTGQIVFNLNEGLGAGTTSTSVEGSTMTMMVAEEIQNLAQNATLPDGNPLPLFAQNSIQTLAQHVMTLGEHEAAFNHGGYPPGGPNSENLAGAYIDYINAFQNVHNNLSTLNPPLLNTINTLTEVVSSVAQQNYLNQILGSTGINVGGSTLSPSELLAQFNTGPLPPVNQLIATLSPNTLAQFGFQPPPTTTSGYPTLPQVTTLPPPTTYPPVTTNPYTNPTY